MIYIVSNLVSKIFEARIHSLIQERNAAILDKDYERVAKLNRKIDGTISRHLRVC